MTKHIAQWWFENIQAMVQAVSDAQECEENRLDPYNHHAFNEAIQAIHDIPISMQVRSDWHAPHDRDDAPVEYQILLTPEGLRITGDLSDHGIPKTARLEWPGGMPRHDAILLSFASHFYFGE